MFFHAAISNHLSIAISMSPEWMVSYNRFNCNLFVHVVVFLEQIVLHKGVKFRCSGACCSKYCYPKDVFKS